MSSFRWSDSLEELPEKLRIREAFQLLLDLLTYHEHFSSIIHLFYLTMPFPKYSHLSLVGRSGDVAATAGPVDVDVLAFGVFLAGVFGLDAEGVGSEVVTLSLEQVGGKVLGAVSIVEAQGRAESGCRNTPEGSLADYVSPALLGVVNGLCEEFVEQQVL